ncbi:VTT domain-containing protein [Paenibacillus sp. KQZ6P-2]|uniref:VTT domain-containing protein n=1 Tax=Paenibacillus mangrovi TaxID=2931978 RepID=A0A9X1WTZ9_9BACL|nr:VTT domain-containing protein [Paenibacillus mangrovi]MCJ8013625.1 VTT domain-containing protein [Paenibacillus mangrovi]
MLDWIMQWIDLHGYLVLFFVPMLELLFLPVSAEFVMGYGGFLVFQGKLNWLISILVAATGSAIGTTLAYWIGYKLGTPFFEKYGSRIHMGPERFNKVSKWFQRYGNKVITINYFITGVRHITGYFSGITRIPFRTYILYAYIGAFLWAATFVSFGKLLGPQWEQYQTQINKYVAVITVMIVVVFVLSFLYNMYKVNIIEFLKKSFKKGEEIFHSPRRVKILIVVTFAVFLSLFVFMLGLIQDFLAKEFGDFDFVTSYIIHAMFDESWSSLMNDFAFLASLQVLVPIVVLTLLWIIFKGKDQILETIFMLIVVIGGEVWEEVLRRFFHRAGHVTSSGQVQYTFPSEQTFITLIVLGFCAFILVRHVKSTWIRYAVSLIVIVVCLLVGISLIFFEVQYPSDVAAGYVFGGVWLSLNVVLLEIFRFFKTTE